MAKCHHQALEVQGASHAQASGALIFNFNIRTMIVKKFENINTEAQINKSAGLPMLHFKKGGEPFTLCVMSDHGSFKENKIGSAHYLEHLLLSGTKKYDSKKKIADEFEKRGCSFEAWTSFFNLYIKEFNNSVADIDFAVSMVEQMLLYSTFNKMVIETERAVILNEIGGTDKDKFRTSRNLVLRTLFPGSRLSLDNKGDANSIKILNRDDLLSTYNDFLNSKKVLITGGDFDADIIKKKFSKVSEKLVFKNQAVLNKRLKSLKGRFAVKHPLGVNGVGIFFERSVYGNGRKTAIHQIINGILFDKGGLILEKLRYEHGLVYKVTDESISNKIIDFFGVFAETSKDKMGKTLSVLEKLFFDEIYRRLNKDNIGKYLIATRLKERRNYRTTDQLIDKYAADFLNFEESLIWHDECLSIIDSVAEKEIVDEVKQTFRKENQSVIVFE